MKNYIITFDIHDDSFREDIKSRLIELGFANMDDNQTTFFGSPDPAVMFIDDEETMKIALRTIYSEKNNQRGNKIDKVSFYYPVLLGHMPMIRHVVVIDREL